MYLALGRRLFAQGGFGPTDPFLFTFKDYAWHVTHEWLSYVVYYGTYLAGGYPALVLLRATLVTCLAALVWQAGERLSPWLRLAVLSLSVYVAAPRCFADRASLFSDLFTVALVFLLPRLTRPGRWLLPLLFLVWIQLHPGFLIGWAVLALGILCLNRNREWAFTFACCVLVCFINPLGVEGVIYPIAKFLSPEWEIFRQINSEWHATWSAAFLDTPYKLAAAALLVVTLLANRRDAFGLLAALLLGYLGISAVRFLALAGFGLGVLLARALPAGPAFGRRWAWALPALALLYTLVWGRYAEWIDPDVPLRAVAALKEWPAANIFNEYDFGGLLAWELDGRMKIAAHGHIDSPALVLQNYFRFSYTRRDWNEIIEANHVVYFFAHRASIDDHGDAAYVKELRGPRWTAIYADDAAYLFMRRSGVP